MIIALNVTIIGEPTLADTYYTEVRVKQLPSKLSTLQFPMQVIRNRKRLSNKPYLPRYVFPGNINDTITIKKWVLKNVGKWRNTATPLFLSCNLLQPTLANNNLWRRYLAISQLTLAKIGTNYQ